MSRLVMQVLGYVFLVLGVAGLVVPVLQGVLFLIIGLILLSRSTSWADNMLDRIKAKYPKLELTIGKAEAAAEKIESRFFRTIGK